MKPRLAALILLAASGVLLTLTGNPDKAPPERTPRGPTETAVFAGGCFWGLQQTFDAVEGVISTRTGYTGGTAPDPNYFQVVSGKTGHAEAVEVVFDPRRVSFGDLLEIFMAAHRPWKGTPPPDYQTRHYRSAVFVTGSAQNRVASDFLESLARDNPAPPATRVEPLTVFWEAEPEHQGYLATCNR